MIDRNTYSAKTIRCLDRLSELKEEISNDKYLEKNKKLYRKKFKAFNNDWDKHIISKKLENSDINTEVNLIRYEINNKLDEDTDKLSDEIVEDGIIILESLKTIDGSIKEVNSFIENDLPKIIDKLDCIRTKAEDNVRMHAIESLERKYSTNTDKLLRVLCSQSITRAKNLEKTFNRIIDGVEVFESINKI